MPGQLKVRVGGGFVPAAAAGGGGGGGSGAAEVWVGPNAPTGAETIWIDTDEAAPVPSDARWDTAWGVVAEGTMPTSTDIATGADAAVTNVLNFTSVSGRKYVISFRTRAAGIYTGSAGQGYGRFVIWDSITNLVHMQDQWFVLPPNISRWDNLTCEFKFNGDGVARGYYVRAYVQDLTAGTVVRFHTESTSSSGWYHIRDIGPVVGSIPAAGSATTAWTALPLSAGWGNYGGAYATPAYRKVGDRVELRGMAASSSPGSSASTVCTLPTGHRPPAGVMFVTWISANSTVYRTAVRIEIGADGQVSFNHHYGLYGQGATSAPTITSVDHISLDGIFFSVTA